MKSAPAAKELIEVDDLRVGMFVHLDMSWMSHPFPLGSFKIASADQVATIRSLGVQRVRWSPTQSDALPPAERTGWTVAAALDGEAAAAAPSTPATASDDETEPTTTSAPGESFSLPPASNESPAVLARHAHKRELAAQRSALLQCERQFAEAAHDCKHLTDLVVAKPAEAKAQAEQLSQALVGKMLGEQELCIRLLSDAAGDKASMHALNVTIISLLMGRTFGLSESDMLDLGVGAMLHDIGKLDLPDRVRHREDHFSGSELRFYEEHVAHGVGHARKMGLSAGATLVIAQHHEHADGSGFPLRLNTDRMTAAARIVSLVNRYDNLCNPNVTAKALTPHESLSLLFAQGKTKFDTAILGAFIRMMGVYPAGSTVQLTDDRYALVVGVNSTRPLKPRVLVHEAKVPRDEALIVDLESTQGIGIRRSIRPAQLPVTSLEYLAPRPRVAYFFEPLAMRDCRARGLTGPEPRVNRDLVASPPLTEPLATWSRLIEAMLDAVWLVDAGALRIVSANHAAGELMAMTPGELIGREVLDLAVTPEDLCFWGEVAAGLVDQIESDTFVMSANGATKAVTRRVSRVAGLGGGADDVAGEGAASAALFVVVLHDRSAQVRVERELEGTAADLRATLESTQDGILVTDLSGRIRNFNQRFASLWQIPPDLLGRREDDAVLEWMRRSVTDPSAYMRRLAAIDDATMLQANDVLRLHSGKVFERVTMPQCMHGRPIGRIFSFRDITEKLEANQRIETLSYTDALTGLPNRRLLADRVEVALAQAKRDGTPFALLFLNLDRFNHINETLGRVFGDRVLLDVADRIKGCVRQVDTVARLGGDEFVVLVNQADGHGAESAAWRVMDALKQPFTQGGMSFTVTASLGISLYPNDGTGIDELVRRADAAMREVKLAGRAGFRFHRPRPESDDAHSRSRMKLDHAMRLALAQGRFRLHYQPQVDLQTGAVVGAEALIRWRDAELGEVSPGEFIPVAEESGFIIAIGDWVLKRAVAQAALWAASGLAMTVSVNVSALQFQQPGFVDGVAAVLREAKLPPQWLELELTESILIQDAQDAMLRLQALAQLGVRLAIDDFGTGYSSLAYLKRFPIGRLKIDRSFVSGLPAEESDVAIVQAIIHMGRALRLQIVAEGVETLAQRQFLQDAGCDLFQGYLYAPALDAAAFEARVGNDLPG